MLEDEQLYAPYLSSNILKLIWSKYQDMYFKHTCRCTFNPLLYYHYILRVSVMATISLTNTPLYWLHFCRFSGARLNNEVSVRFFWFTLVVTKKMKSYISSTSMYFQLNLCVKLTYLLVSCMFWRTVGFVSLKVIGPNLKLLVPCIAPFSWTVQMTLQLAK